MRELILLRVIARLLIPFILMFAFYVQFHGDFGPGGGFQAGVIFAVAFILYGLLYGIDTASKVVPEWIVRWGLAAGVLLFGGTGVAGLLLNGEYLNYSVLRDNPVEGQHLGIILVELGVGLTVASAMVLIFFSFARHGR